jgi:replicative DNA helicase Mcm
MDVAEQIKKYHEFIEREYINEVLENIRKGENKLIISFLKLIEFDPELGNDLLEKPEEGISAAELAIKEFDLPAETRNFKVRLTELPPTQKIFIKDIRSKNLNKLYYMEGVVRQKSDVRPQVTTAKFECPSCGNILSVLQLETKFKEPNRCGCGRKGKFRLLSKDLIDAQRLVLEEAPEDLEGGEQPKRIGILLKDDLVSPMTDRQTNPGNKVLVVGSIKEVPLTGRDGSKLTRFDLIVEANYIEASNEDYSQIEISQEDEEFIMKLSKDPNVFHLVLNSIAPSIFGYERVKEAIALQLVGGVRKTRTDGTVTRGDMHVLLIGDPGAGKSQMLKRTAKISSKARYVSGKGVSGAGLTASVVKDEFLGGWSLEAGALPLANKGICCIDEMDKMSVEDTSAMHEALEGQTITISKANIQATLRAETTVLAAANPKFGRFDPYDILAKQINMPPALINRFDLIFTIKDLPNTEKDNLLASHILNLHKDPDIKEPEITTEMLRKYIAYARQRCKPKLSDEAMEEIKKYYVEMRNSSGSEEAGIKAVPISARQLEALVRLSEATAKLRMSKEVSKDDAKRAIDILHFSLSEIGIDPETGKIDIDRIASGITASQRSKIHKIKDIIIDLENKLGKTIPIEDIVEEAKNKDVPEDHVEEAIEKLKRSGDIFEPKKGFVSRI